MPPRGARTGGGAATGSSRKRTGVAEERRQGARAGSSQRRTGPELAGRGSSTGAAVA
jgi:hypothetical protein